MKDTMGPSRSYAIALNYILLFAVILIIFLPMFIVFNISFKTNQEYLYSAFYAPPENFLNFDNYLLVIEKGKILLGFRNTVILAVVAILGSITMGTMVAYALGRFKFKMKKFIMNAFLISTIIPSITTQVATFTVIKNLGLYNTLYAGMILYIATDIVQIYIFLQFVGKIPYELDESALVDGASFFKIYRSIILPQLKPAIATACILKLINVYNDMFTPYLYMPKASLRTVTTSLMMFSYDRNSQWNVMAAGIIALMIPTLLVYLFLQKYIISGMASGAVKE